MTGNGEDKSPSEKADGKRKFPAQMILPVVALGLSVVSFYMSQSAQKEVGRLDAVKTQYGLYDSMARLQLDYPLMEHLFATNGQAYDAVCTTIRTAMSSLSGPERAKLQLQERALAHSIFTAYEETYMLRGQAVGGDAGRLKFLDTQLAYFNDLFRHNPRLFWFWDEAGGRQCLEFAGDLQDYYHEHVKDSPTSPDTTGPLQLEKEKTQ